ncbi:MAG: hypothetical protein HGB10_01520 [Coriobacteriia bacterium]|nr:hypothetical protein [Coriobacteriia bacterium]
MANDGDIHFPPGQRRDKPSFEPPPWEREQFEELAKRREEPAAEAETARIEEQPSVQAEPAASQAVEPEDADPADSDQPAELDPKHVEALLAGLKAEEPSSEGLQYKVMLAAGVVSAFVGLVVTTWGAVALASPKGSGSASTLIAMVPLVFGIGFLAGGVWVVFSSLRRQGVL